MPFRRLDATRSPWAPMFRALCFSSLLVGSAWSQWPSAAKPAQPATYPFPKPMPGWSLPQRQTLTYAVDWRVFPAGSVTVHMEADGPVEHITAAGDSAGAINLLFRVSDRFESTLDRATGCSQNFNRQILEGHRQVQSQQRFDGARGISTYDEKNLISRKNRHETVAMPPCVTDILSGIFYGGSQPLEPGTTFHLPVVSSTHLTSVAMHVEARETVRTPTTTYHAVRVQPVAESGPVRNRGMLWIYYSDDERHIPVELRARLFWGTLTFRLTGIDNK